MKIEKLTEDKIRVIINLNELNINEDNCHNTNFVMTKAIESQDFFLNILNRAEKEVNFNTDGCKLFIELSPSLDDLFVFTIIATPDNYVNSITNSNTDPQSNTRRKKVIAKRKNLSNNIHNHAICLFNNFDVFCDFCYALKILHKVNYNSLTTDSSLYLWKNYYYLVLKNIDIKSKNSFLLYSILSEFTKNISFSKTFEAKLAEYGEIIIDKNAIEIGINFFTTKN